LNPKQSLGDETTGTRDNGLLIPVPTLLSSQDLELTFPVFQLWV